MTRSRSVSALLVVTIMLVAATTALRAQAPAARAAASREQRIPAPAESAWTAEQRALAAEFASGGRLTNDLRTFLVHPDLVRGVMPFANYVTGSSTLSMRHRALLVLRTAWLSRSDYMWAKHAADAAQAGLSRVCGRRGLGRGVEGP
jgi:uncharacterized membrane protein